MNFENNSKTIYCNMNYYFIYKNSKTIYSKGVSKVVGVEIDMVVKDSILQGGHNGGYISSKKS